MTTAPRCQQCGAPVEDGALFCSKCGVDVSGMHPAHDATVEMPASGPPASHVRSTMRQTLRDATLGEYEILNELGRGGMATVFLAHDISLDRKVAIKVMAPHLLEGEGMAERFKLEARTAAQLSHPHIIPIYAVRETEETLYFIMKYIEGRGLDEIVKKMAPLPIPMVKDIMTKVGAALGYAHRRDVVHRDVKPGNIMIDEEGTPIVTDFGIAKVAEAQGLTMTGATIGTPTYMSPEQCEAKEVTGASDQYSLGVVAFEMLTGKVPFEGDTAVSTMYKHCHEPLPPLEDFRPDCPPELRETITRMLAKAPSDRWPSLEAAIKKLGTGTDPHLDPIRSHLLELAKEGDANELLAHLSTPGTPLPGLTTDPRAVGAATTGGAVAAPAGGRARSRLVAAGVGLVVVAGGALAVMQPWRGGQSELAGGSGSEVVGPAGGAATEGGAPGGGEGPPTRGGEGALPGGGEDGGADAQQDGGDPGGAGATGAGAGGVEPTSGGGAQPAGGERPSGGVTSPPAEPRPVAVASVRIDGPRDVAVGDELTLGATALSASNDVLDRGPPTWSVTDESVGRITTGGRFTAVGEGSVEVIASIDGVPGRARVVVAPAPVANVSITPSEVALEVGARARVEARAEDRAGGALSGRTVRWVSGDESIATVDGSGQVVAVGAGSTRLTAEVEGVSASVPVTITVDTRTAIEGLLAEYEQALESEDMARIRRFNTELAPQTAAQLENTFRSVNELEVDIDILSLDETATTATARILSVWRFVDQREGRMTMPAQEQTAHFERVGNGWRMVGIR